MSHKKHQADDLEHKLSQLLILEDTNKTKMEFHNVHPKKQPSEDRTVESSKEVDSEVLLKVICPHFVKDMNEFGISVIDSFLGSDRGDSVFEEVNSLHQAGLFQDGQLVKNDTKNKDIRGDEILWLAGNEPLCPSITHLINEIDLIVMTANKLPFNGKLGKYKIESRTKAMVACYPGNGSHYVKHVDNPNRDGRILTAIYYLNKDWDPEVHGGRLRIFPNEERKEAADIDPKFDRLLFFWSDRRNPHEVQPSYRTRYAITIWYFDAVERQAAQKRGGQQQFYSDDDKKTKLKSNLNAL